MIPIFCSGVDNLFRSSKDHGLLGYFDGSRTPPNASIVSATGAEISNPEFEIWEKQDQLLLAWLTSSLTASVFAQALSCETTHSLWTTLHDLFTSKAQSKVLELKNRLQNLKKGGSTCAEFVSQIQAIADELRLIGHHVSDSDLILNLFGGLGSEYNPFVTSLTNSTIPLSMATVRSKLLTYEARLLSQLSESNPVAFTAATASGTGSIPSLSTTLHSIPDSDQALFQAFLTQQFSNFKRNITSGGFRGRGGRHNKGRGTGRSSSTNHIVPAAPQLPLSVNCQICHRTGHTADICWYRYKHGQQTSNSTAHAQPHVLLAEPSPSPSTDWFLDSGATSHITNDLNSMTAYQPYKDTDTVRVGNGASLSILHIGSCSLPTLPSGALQLRRVLYVPRITRKLLSVSQLLLDNAVSIEFSNTACFVKDSKTHQVLLKGELEHGLYRISTSQFAYIGEHDTSSIWHFRLAHPSVSVLQRLASLHFIPSQKQFLCDPCHRAKSHSLSYSLSTNRSSCMLQLLHLDLWGPAPVTSHMGNRFYLLIVDDFSRFTWLFPIKSKSKTLQVFASFKLKAENQFSTSVKTIQWWY